MSRNLCKVKMIISCNKKKHLHGRPGRGCDFARTKARSSGLGTINLGNLAILVINAPFLSVG